ncbi:hypothetical protein DPMN_019130 [Dreissena polymorpha]|uniref:Uncharacterized protein n=1 Tax=Dreissena polymorpha TaxID=45954 RepID=A0A9D4NIM4_DREPO|nr:hypothetical protein DPMN_019130 [Dreissena polymorpha]
MGHASGGNSICNKVLKVNPSECVTNHFKTKQPHIDSTIKKALKNDSSFDVSSSLLFDSQPNVS